MSAVPATIDALVSLLTTALPAVEVFDGPGLTDSSAPQRLHVGMSDAFLDGPQEVVASSTRWLTLGPQIREETFALHCVALCWSGDDAVKPVRDQVYALLAQVESALVADQSFGGVVSFSPGMRHAHEVVLGAAGATVQIRFDIDCTAELRS